MKNKRVWFAALLLCVSAAAVAAVGCKKPTHTHAYVDVAVDPTCTEQGYTEHICECGDSYRDAYTDARGHAYVDTVVPAGCTAQGYTEHVCEICGDTVIDTYTDARGHTYGSVISLNAESHRIECDRCHVEKQGSTQEHTMLPDGDGVKCSACGFGAAKSEGLQFTLTDDGKGYAVSAGTFHSAVLVIPDEYNGLPVVSVARNAFSECTSWIRNIVLPKGLQSVEKNGWSNFRPNRVFFRGTLADWCAVDFADASANPVHNSLSGELYVGGKLLTAAEIPQGVTKIADYAFAGCKALESVTFPAGLTAIGKAAFADCSEIKTVHIPAGLTDIAADAFNGCALETVTSDSTGFVVKGNCWIDAANKTLIRGNENSVIPTDGSVTEIAAQAFKNVAIRTLVIPDSVTKIGAFAFSGCDALTQVTLSKHITVIDEFTFQNCTSLNKIVIPDGVTEIKEGAFNACSKLYSVTLGTKVKTIYSVPSFSFGHYDAFASCSNLVEVYNRSTLSLTKGDSKNGSVARYAQDVYTDSSPSKLEETADGFLFYNGDTVKLLAYTGSNATLTLPADYRGKTYAIADYAFYKNPYLQTVTVPTVSGLGYAAFSGCENLKSVTLAGGFTTLTGNTFFGCTALESVRLYKGLTKIGASAFEGCDALPALDVPDTVTALGVKAFKNCASLTAITLPAGLTDLGGNGLSGETFYGCLSLRAIAVPDGVTVIPGYAFMYCRALANVTVGTGVTKIRSYAFKYCTSLTKIVLPRVNEIQNNAFEACTSLTKVDMPEATKLGEQAFSDCVALNTVAWPKLQSIGKYAFSGCLTLAAVTFPDSTITIGYGAFMNCTDLRSVDLGNGALTVGDYAFYNCDKVTQIDLGDHTTAVGYAAFYGCTPESVYIPASVTTIKAYAFAVDSETTDPTCTDIYCAASEKPDGWEDGWDLNGDDTHATVHYNATPPQQ